MNRRAYGTSCLVYSVSEKVVGVHEPQFEPELAATVAVVVVAVIE